jgi:hypothetical protein
MGENYLLSCLYLLVKRVSIILRKRGSRRQQVAELIQNASKKEKH